MTEQNKTQPKVNPFTLFLILILLLGTSGALAALLGKLRPTVTNTGHDTYHNEEKEKELPTL